MNHVLVAYFSASGVTKRVAEKIAKAANAELFEIIPEQPYTIKDLDWHDSNSRSSVEMNDKSSRPSISDKIENMESYNTVLIGFPIWWYVAPTIINTFLESYDFSGKKIILFATSGSSGMGKTMEELKPSASRANFIAEKRVEAGITQAETDKWIKSLNIH